MDRGRHQLRGVADAPARGGRWLAVGYAAVARLKPMAAILLMVFFGAVILTIELVVMVIDSRIRARRLDRADSPP